ncbi:hypothetical protein M427DRAFT_131744 [Gonapodya prolifera JEL478]|uniref:Uncharacterized protein n=1 Tax=Gonapodya prolifera (strain JEL478) TaxID=1344416 RepID=A0A139ASS3_GONPJ|nr:hypothetical protein M427DRAFT_131744 [Gonapodya prolifera JEL478]|eukprot:KXS19759.1 hypothetical protein M427DRAFT_131744 [Gonapodya prolifera JEL478]
MIASRVRAFHSTPKTAAQEDIAHHLLNLLDIVVATLVGVPSFLKEAGNPNENLDRARLAFSQVSRAFSNENMGQSTDILKSAISCANVVVGALCSPRATDELIGWMIEMLRSERTSISSDVQVTLTTNLRIAMKMSLANNHIDLNRLLQTLLNYLQDTQHSSKAFEEILNLIAGLLQTKQEACPVNDVILQQVVDIVFDTLMESPWSTQDATLTFVKTIFESELTCGQRSPTGDVLVLRSVVAALVVKCADEDPFLRLTPLATFPVLANVDSRWKSIRDEDKRLICAAVLGGLDDAETNVRRSSLESLTRLVVFQPSLVNVMRLAGPHCPTPRLPLFDRSTMENIFDDPDNELRALGVRFVHALWTTFVEPVLRASVDNFPENVPEWCCTGTLWFFELECHTRILSLTLEFSPIVRRQILSVVNSMRDKLLNLGDGDNLKAMTDGHNFDPALLTDFVSKILAIDVDSLERSLVRDFIAGPWVQAVGPKADTVADELVCMGCYDC